MSVKDYIKAEFNAGQEVIYSETSVTLSDLVTQCDFLKIDTDGHDLRVLHGAEKLFKTVRPLAILTEADLHGDPKNGDSSLSGITEFLHGHGYTWLDVQMHRFSRSSLPQTFRYSITAQTNAGPLGFCDATYVDDPLSRPGKLSEWLRLGTGRALKLLAIYDLLDFPDCAAELILALSRHPSSANACDWHALLQILDPDYEARIAKFKSDHKNFF